MLSDKYMITARYSTVSKSIHHDYREKVLRERFKEKRNYFLFIQMINN